MFGHRDTTSSATYVNLKTSSARLQLSQQHFVPVCLSGCSKEGLRQAVVQQMYAQDVQVRV